MLRKKRALRQAEDERIRQGLRKMEGENEHIFRMKLRIRTLLVILALLLLIGLGIFFATSIVTGARSFPIYMKGESGGISLCAAEDFGSPTTHLSAKVPEVMDNISVLSLPGNLDAGEGSHNGSSYVAYSFYVRNNETEEREVTAAMHLDSVSKNADEAIRVRVFRNGAETTYAKAAADGGSEYGTDSFADEEFIFRDSLRLKQEEKIKYTIVIWLEGDDPECTDSIRGGSVRVSMEFALPDAETESAVHAAAAKGEET